MRNADHRQPADLRGEDELLVFIIGEVLNRQIDVGIR